MKKQLLLALAIFGSLGLSTGSIEARFRGRGFRGGHHGRGFRGRGRGRVGIGIGFGHGYGHYGGYRRWWGPGWGGYYRGGRRYRDDYRRSRRSHTDQQGLRYWTVYNRSGANIEVTNDAGRSFLIPAGGSQRVDHRDGFGFSACKTGGRSCTSGNTQNHSITIRSGWWGNLNYDSSGYSA